MPATLPPAPADPAAAGDLAANAPVFAPPRARPVPPAATMAECGPNFAGDRAAGVATGWRCGAVFALAFAAALLTVENYWRGKGFEPSVTDNPALWGHHRVAAKALPPDGVALVGSSRMQVGFHPATFRKMFPGRELVNLSMAANMPGGVLEDLANDEDFRGTVICDLNASHLYPQQYDAGRELAEQGRAAGPGGRWAAFFAAQAQGRMACLQPNVGWRRTLEKWLGGREPSPSYRRVLLDRSRPTDYAGLPEKTRRRVREGRVAKTRGRTYAARDFPEWRGHAVRLGELVTKIRDRGGDVAFVRFPTTAEHWAATAGSYPRERFWDRLRRYTGARTVHFRDLPETRDLKCPDTSHLDAADAPRFTEAILKELDRVHVL